MQESGRLAVLVIVCLLPKILVNSRHIENFDTFDTSCTMFFWKKSAVQGVIVNSGKSLSSKYGKN